MVGSAITRKLISQGYNNFVFTPYPEYDLTNQSVVAEFLAKEKPDYVVLAAAKVGGIMANNTLRAQFIYENIMIQSNIIHNSYLNGVKKLLFLGSSCIYPRSCPQPIKEEYLLTGELEYTNEPYAIAKIAGIKMCESYNIQYDTNFISVMPTNLFGPNDNYDLATSHVLPALIRKIHLGKCLGENNWTAIRKDLKARPIDGVDDSAGDDAIFQVLKKHGIELHPDSKGKNVTLTLWGSGSPFREFLYVDDMADACIYLMQNVSTNDIKSLSQNTGTENRFLHLNIGTGKDLRISELAEVIKSIIGFTGEIAWDSSKPDGTARKLLDVSRINSLGWKESIDLEEGIKMVYSNYIQ